METCIYIHNQMAVFMSGGLGNFGFGCRTSRAEANHNIFQTWSWSALTVDPLSVR